MGAAFEAYMMGKAIVKLAEDNIRLCKENKERSRCLDEAFKKKFGILKENDMEKKKMTKAEAFEWLKYKKIDAEMHADMLQKKLFSLGILWGTGENYYILVNYLLINENGELRHCGNDEAYFKSHCYEEVKAEDILSLEIEEEKCGSQCGESAWEEIGRIGAQISDILRGINGHYHVEITEDSVNLYPEGTNLFHSDPF